MSYLGKNKEFPSSDGFNGGEATVYKTKLSKIV
jgi:hypothetical protein